MKTALPLAALALLLTLHNSPVSTVHAQGTLTPPGAPAATMRTLDQIYARGDTRQPITNASSAVTITVPGSYYLTTNLTISSGTAITIATSGVTLDLNGQTIRSTAANATSYAIRINSGLRNITIEQGFIESGVTNDGSGVYSGSGFVFGIYFSGTAPENTRVANVSVAGCLTYGIYLNTGGTTVVEACTVRTLGSTGIRAAIIKGCVAEDCGGSAIAGGQITDSRGESTGAGYGIYAATALNCSGISASGDGLFATTALNCSGVSTSGDGIYATTAQNCYGSSSSGDGLYAYRAANNCFGISTSGRGLVANNASFCTGQRNGGTAILATMATGCIAVLGTNSISYKYNMP